VRADAFVSRSSLVPQYIRREKDGELHVDSTLLRHVSVRAIRIHVSVGVPGKSLEM